MKTQSVSETERLARGIRRCRSCPLHGIRTHAVPGEGPETAEIVFVGEAPGEAEDASGRPFVGRCSRVFDEALERNGIVRAEVFVTSMVKCRPPGNRDPKPTEARTCRDRWLRAQLDAVDPRIVVLLGRVAATSCLELDEPLRAMRGSVRIERETGRRILVTYHPAAAMRFPDARSAFDADIRRLARMAKTSSP